MRTLLMLALLSAACRRSAPVAAAQAGADAVCACSNLDCAMRAMNRRGDRLIAVAHTSLGRDEVAAMGRANQRTQACLRQIAR